MGFDGRVLLENIDFEVERQCRLVAVENRCRDLLNAAIMAAAISSERRVGKPRKDA